MNFKTTPRKCHRILIPEWSRVGLSDHLHIDCLFALRAGERRLKPSVCSQAYAAGCNIVILASTFERVQIIPGAIHNYIRISCLDCSTDTGKIAAAYENQVCIFEPTPAIHTSAHVSGTQVNHARISIISESLQPTCDFIFKDIPALPTSQVHRKIKNAC